MYYNNLHIEQYWAMNQDESQYQLQQIRNAIFNSHPLAREDIESFTEEDVRNYLKQSRRLVQDDSLDMANPQVVHSKISEARKLLQGEKPMIQGYVRDKIQSELFGGKNFKSYLKQYEQLMDKKDELEMRRLQQKLDDQKNVQTMIESTRKFRNYEYNKQVPLPKIESLVQRQNVDYDKIIKQEHRLKSSNNSLSVNESDLKQKFQQFKKESFNKYGGLRVKDMKSIEEEDFMIEVNGDEQNQETYREVKANRLQNQIADMLRKNKNFTATFKQFLVQILQKLAIVEKMNEIEQLNLEHNSSKPQEKYRFIKKFPSSRSHNAHQNFELSSLSKAYKFKAFQLTKPLQTYQGDESVRKLVNKKIGQTNKFHIKQVIIIGNTFYYSEEQNSGDEGKKIDMKDMKTIELCLAPIEIKKVKKEEGGLFQAKDSQVNVGVIKGKTRTFTYEIDYAEGQQLTNELNMSNLRRLHRINCAIRGANNKHMQKFIEGQHQVLDLSGQYFRPEDEYPEKGFRSWAIRLILDLFPRRKSTRVIDLSRCRLSFSELSLVLMQIENQFTNLTTVNVSHTKVDKQCLKNILNLMKKGPPNSTISLDLSYCQLNDDILEANMTNFISVCPKIGWLNLEGNQLSSKSLKLLSSILSTKICQIKVLNLSYCPVQQFIQVCQLVKNAKRLQRISVRDSSLTITAGRQVQNFLASMRDRPELKQMDLRGNVFTGSARWFQEINPHMRVRVSLPNKTQSALQSKFVRLQVLPRSNQ